MHIASWYLYAHTGKRPQDGVVCSVMVDDDGHEDGSGYETVVLQLYEIFDY